ncbi:MAG: formyltransferase family protein, partial [Campylobacterales bacterium]
MKKVTLLISTFNSTSQLAYTHLKALGYRVDVIYAISASQMIKEVEEFKPDIILSPYLKKFIPKEIYDVYPTFVLHPGIRGDRGAYSLDNAIKDVKKEWGVVYLKADDNFDGGNIYAEVDFEMRESYKASLYRNEVN